MSFYLSHYALTKFTADLESLKIHDIELIVQAKNAHINVVQVQQCLTDISATRALPGFDDGYMMAEKHANLFRKNIHNIQTYYLKDNKAEDLAAAEELLASFDSFTRLGIQMATVYIQKGPEEGNIFMAKLDPFAVELAEKLERFVINVGSTNPYSGR